MVAAAIRFVLVAVLLGIASFKDIRTREIPDWISVGVALTALIGFRLDNLWGMIVAVMFFAVALRTGKIGGGDVKLIAALSVGCGLWSSLALLFFAQLSMLVFYGISVIVQRSRGRTAEKAPGGSFCLPFVPFIFFGYLCSELIF